MTRKLIIVFLWLIYQFYSESMPTTDLQLEHLPSLTVVPLKEIELDYLRQASTPTIEYKYVIKTILPRQDLWWKRGTHRFYAQDPKPKIIEA